METIKWIRPSGSEIETNGLDETIEYCISLGWKPAEDETDASGEPFDPEIHYKSRAMDDDGNWKVKKAARK